MPQLNSSVASTIVLCTCLAMASPFGCVTPTTEHHHHRASPSSPAPVAPRHALTSMSIEASRMMTDIDFLASDAMAGRYTLAPELARAARWIARRHAEMGLIPPLDDFENSFSVKTATRIGEAPTVFVIRRRGVIQVQSEAFAPLALSANDVARGPLVFVGYGAQSKNIAGSNGNNRVYDDLRGLDLKGKIALLLAHQPNSPNPTAIFDAMKTIAADFNSVDPISSQGTTFTRLAERHRFAREELAKLLDPWIQGQALPDRYWELTSPLKSELDLPRLASFFWELRQGPEFNVEENSLRAKIERIERAGAMGVILVEGPRSKIGLPAQEADRLMPLDHQAPKVLKESVGIPVVQMRWRRADALFRIGKYRLSTIQAQIDQNIRPQSRPVRGVEIEIEVDLRFSSRQIPNVLAMIPGTDLAEQIVVIGAHYDHIGTQAHAGGCVARKQEGIQDSICNGADDNASGTAMVLEIARAIQERRNPPRRTIIFAHFAGEELGLLGSKALVKAPPFDLGKVVAMINLDMVGRLGVKGLLIGGVGSSPAWMPLLEDIGARGLHTTYDALVTSRSDHATFYRHNIPVLFFFTGTHADYHRPGDQVARLNSKGLQSIGEIVADTLWALAQGRPLTYSIAGEHGGLTPRLPGAGQVIREIGADIPLDTFPIRE